MASTAEFSPVPAPRPGTARFGEDRSDVACLPWRRMEDEIAAWDALAAEASEPNPFYESWYLLPSLRALDPAGDVTLLRFDTGGRFAGLMPLVRRRRYYRWPLPHLSGWLHENCFLGAPLVARGQERAFWQALLSWADARAGTALFLHLRQMPVSGALVDALKEVTGEQGRKTALVHHEERAMLASGLSPEAYLEAALSGKKRKELRRQTARLGELAPTRFERCRDGADLDAWIDRFLALENAGWKGKAGSALACDPATAGLFRESLRGAAARGKLERLTLWSGDTAVAMLATFLTLPGAYSYKTAFDESYARFSPGVLLQRENLAVLERGEIAWSDSCASADHPMIDHFWRERRAVGSISVAIGGRLRRAAFGALVNAELHRTPAGGEL